MPATNPAAAAATKADSRRASRRRRAAYTDSLSPAQRADLESALATLVAPLLRGHDLAASYAAGGAEIDPRHIHARLQAIAYPRACDRDLVFHRCTADLLSPGFGGILEPPATAPQATPALLLVPLLAATPAGIRLGQGGGFYDRTLKALRARGPVIAIGLAWDVQLVDDLPHDPWDEPLDHVATPTRLVDCAGNR